MTTGTPAPSAPRAPVHTRRGRRVSRPALALIVIVLIVAVVFGAARAVLFSGDRVAAETWRLSATGPRSLVHAFARAPWGTLYAGSPQGVYASVDGGVTWRPVGHGLPGGEVWGLAAARDAGGDEVWAATEGGFVYRQAVGAGAWTRAGASIGTQSVYALLALPPSGGSAVILAGSDEGIFRSTDGGATWTRVAAIVGAVTTLARDPANGALYAGLAGLPDTLRVSRDGGRTWRIPGGRLPPASVEALLTTPGHLYVGVMRTQGGEAVWSGGAGGAAPLTVGLPGDSHGMALAGTTSSALSASSSDPTLFVGTMGVGVYGKAAGSAWTRLGSGPGDGTVTALLVVPGPRPVVLAGTSGGIYRLRLP